MSNQSTADVVVRSQQKGKQVYDRVRKQMDSLKKGATAVTAAFGIAAGGVSLLTKRSFENIDALAKHADRIGTSTTRLKALQILTELNGGSSENLSKSLLRAQKALGEFNTTGSGSAAPFLKQLNLDTEALANKKPDELFEVYAEAIRGMGTRSEQVAATTALFGDRTGEMLNLIDQGTGVLEKAEEDVDRYNLALDRVDSAKVEAANDAMLMVRERFQGVGNTISAKVSPFVTAFANRIIDTGTEADVMGNAIDKAMDIAAVGVGIVADSFFGLKLTFKAVEVGVLTLAGKSISSFAGIESAVITVQNKMSETFGSGAIKNAESGILNQMQDSLEASAQHANEMLQNLAAAERPSVAIGRAMTQARLDAEANAKALVNSRKKLEEIEIEPSEDASEDAIAKAREIAEQTRLRDSLANKIAIIEEGLRSEEERELFAHERRMELIGTALNNELITKARAMELEAGISEQHQERLNKIHLKALNERQKFEAKSSKDRAKQVFNDLDNITAGVATHNKALFRLNQAAAIANAVINTSEGVTKTLSAYPMPLAAALAATHLAAGVVQINAIRSAQFGGGSTPSAVGSTPTFNGQPLDRDFGDSIGGSERTDTAPGVQISIVVEGSLIGDAGIREVVGNTIREAVNQDELLIDPNSRQAIEIREGTGTGG